MAKLGRVELGWAEGGVASMRGEVAIGLLGKGAVPSTIHLVLLIIAVLKIPFRILSRSRSILVHFVTFSYTRPFLALFCSGSNTDVTNKYYRRERSFFNNYRIVSLGSCNMQAVLIKSSG